VTVVDASAVVELLLRSPRAPALEAWLFGANDPIEAPQLLDLEVTQVLRRLDRDGEMPAGGADQALGVFTAMPIRRHAHTPLLTRIWALRGNLSAYDAAYVALAEALHQPLITRDRRLAATRGHLARIELV
jgi:predicted nucleic acid-binding protein